MQSWLGSLYAAGYLGRGLSALPPSLKSRRDGMGRHTTGGDI